MDENKKKWETYMSDKPIVDPDLGIEINGAGRQYFDNVIIDNLMDAIIEMSATLWTVRDRQIVLEKILEEKGIDANTLIEAYIPNENDLAARLYERDEMVQRIFRSFVRRPTDATALDADAPSLREITD